MLALSNIRVVVRPLPGLVAGAGAVAGSRGRRVPFCAFLRIFAFCAFCKVVGRFKVLLP